MNLITELITAFKRYRSAKGFGIHSPSAFKFVTEIVHSPYAYYADEELIDHAPTRKDTGQLIHDALLLHRIVARLSPEHFVVGKHREKIITEAVIKADSRIIISHRPKEAYGTSLIFAHRGDFKQTEIEQKLREYGNILVLRGYRRDEVTQMTSGLDCGIVLTDRNLSIILTSDKMRLCTYDVKL